MPLANADSFFIPLKDKSVHCIVTSTPYFGLRVYDGVRPTVFGGRPDCEHEWVTASHDLQPHGDDGTSGNPEGGRATQTKTRGLVVQDAECTKCGAWRGFFGAERLHDCLAWARGEPPCGKCFVCHFRELAREMWRVLRDDGTLWLVIGDSFARNGGTPGGGNRELMHMEGVQQRMCNIPDGYGLKPKDKVMVPERARLALQADGWYVRSVAPWLKLNSMPESVKDRPSVAHEDIILLSKSQRYFYDVEAVRKPQVATSQASLARGVSDHHKNVNGVPGQTPHSISQPRSNVNFGSKQDGVGKRTYIGFNARWNLSQTFARPSGKNAKLVVPGQAAPSHRADHDDVVPAGRNRRTTDWFFESLDGMIAEAESQLAYMRSVREKGELVVDEAGNPLAFLVNPKGYKGAHYATFPLDLISPMILASTSQHGVCPECGAPWERVTSGGFTAHTGKTNSLYQTGMTANRPALLRQTARENGGEYVNDRATVGWRPTCDCYDDLYRAEYPRTTNARRRAHQDAQNDWWPRARQRCGHPDWAIKPALVLDPFVGSGTTVEAACHLGRVGIGLDVSLKYLQENALPRAERRNMAKAVEELPLFAHAAFELAAESEDVTTGMPNE